MFWDKVSPIYDLVENIYNRKVYNGTGKKVAELIDDSDLVLECACGTGAITVIIASACNRLVATDFASGMLKRAQKKCSAMSNITFEKADITDLGYPENSFDKVIAGNVIHLLAKPEKAMAELERVAKPGGKIIIPTYINKSKGSSRHAVKVFELFGANFNQQFDLESYKAFFNELGYEDVDYSVVDGRMPCAIAVITKV